MLIKLQVFEQSSFLNEVGAAINIPPNAGRVLKAWGCDFKVLDPTPSNHLTVHDEMGRVIFQDAVGSYFLFDMVKVMLRTIGYKAASSRIERDRGLAVIASGRPTHSVTVTSLGRNQRQEAKHSPIEQSQVRGMLTLTFLRLANLLKCSNT